jgi:DNA-binding response OmpR family regulator
MSRKILIIDDDPDIVHLLEMHLRDEGYAVASALDGEKGLARAEAERFDLIILDVMLPGKDGLEICSRLRAGASYTPILMLTCKSAELDRVLGFELGADDYVTKPFSIRELQARVKALLRRVEALRASAEGDAHDIIEAGGLVIDVERRHVTRAGRPVELTAREFDLLLHFARNPGRVFTRSHLLDSVWGYGYEGQEHTVNSHINRLRAKIEDDPARPRFILTVRGVGYKFTDDTEGGARD